MNSACHTDSRLPIWVNMSHLDEVGRRTNKTQDKIVAEELSKIKSSLALLQERHEHDRSLDRFRVIKEDKRQLEFPKIKAKHDQFRSIKEDKRQGFELIGNKAAHDRFRLIKDDKRQGLESPRIKEEHDRLRAVKEDKRQGLESPRIKAEHDRLRAVKEDKRQPFESPRIKAERDRFRVIKEDKRQGLESPRIKEEHDRLRAVKEDKRQGLESPRIKAEHDRLRAVKEDKRQPFEFLKNKAERDRFCVTKEDKRRQSQESSGIKADPRHHGYAQLRPLLEEKKRRAEVTSPIKLGHGRQAYDHKINPRCRPHPALDARLDQNQGPITVHDYYYYPLCLSFYPVILVACLMLVVCALLSHL